MPNFAEITLIGHLTKNAETQFTAQGTAITRFDLAVNTGWGDNKQVTFYKCAMFGERSKTVAQYLTKGKPILVTGEPSLRKNTADDGRTFTNLNVRVNEIVLLGSNGGGQSNEPEAQAPQDDEKVPF